LKGRASPSPGSCAQNLQICSANVLIDINWHPAISAAIRAVVTGWSTMLCAIWHFSAGCVLRLTVR